MKVYCNHCEKEVVLKDNKCPNCGMEFIPEAVEVCKEEYYNTDVNGVSFTCKIVGVIILVAGLIMGIVLGKDIVTEEFSFWAMLSYWLTYGGIALGAFAVGEIIQILHDIRAKVQKK